MAHDTNTYKFVGISTSNGTQAVRYTNDKNRARVLERNGHSDIHFVELHSAERVEDCIDVLMNWVESNEKIEYADTVRQEAERLGFVF